MPFPSRGCKTCRQRRVKCDEIRPVCGSCARLDRECGGYQYDVVEGALTFVSENKFAGGLSRRPRRQKVPSTTRTRSTQSFESSFSAQPDVARQNSPRLSLTIVDPLEEQAKMQFLHRHVDKSVSLPKTMISHLCALSRRTSAESSVGDDTLSFAFSAIALAFLGKTRPDPTVLVMAKDKYMRALGKLKTGLSSKEHSTSDQVLIAVMLMSKYENMTSQSNAPNLTLESLHHMDGAKALLKIRQERQAMQDQDRSLDRNVRSQIIRQAVYRGEAVPDWLSAGQRFGEEGIELQLDTFIVRAALLRHDSAQCLKSQFSLINALQLLGRARALDGELESWVTSIPAEYAYETHIKPFSYSGTTSSYHSIAHATIWNRYRAVRLVANCLIRKLAGLVALGDQDDGADMQSHILYADTTTQIMVNDICSSAPFILSDIDAPASAVGAFSLSWPLTIAAVVPNVPDAQRQWIKDEVRLISKITSSDIFDRVASLDLHLKSGPISIHQLQTKSEDD